MSTAQELGLQKSCLTDSFSVVFHENKRSKDFPFVRLAFGIVYFLFYSSELYFEPWQHFCPKILLSEVFQLFQIISDRVSVLPGLITLLQKKYSSPLNDNGDCPQLYVFYTEVAGFI